MATGGIFQLITNDGKQDRMLMASALLKKRIADASAKRASQGMDPTPTLYDIERTHILFTNAHFKPFAAIGYEYNKVKPSAGASALDSSITFSIPQFGDFFNDMVVHAILKQPTMSLTDGNNVTVADSDKNLMRWCDYPGERLLKKVRFEVNGNPLDEYTRDAVNFHREFSVQPNKEAGWARNMGQEESEDGFLDQPNWVGSGVDSAAVQHRMVAASRSGNQTPTGQKTDNLELFIPLLFWCNKDPRLAVPSVAIPYGQRFITMDLCSPEELVGIVPRGANAGSFSNSAVDAGGAFTNADNSLLQKIELYINNIFVNPEVHNIFIKRIGFSLIRVHRQQDYVDNAGGDTSLLLQNLKWPIEALFIGMRVADYTKTTGVDARANLDKWHKFSSVTNTQREDQGWCSARASVASGDDVVDVLPLVTQLDVAAAAGVYTGVTLTAGVGEFLFAPGLQVGQVIRATTPTGDFTGTVASVDALGTVATLVETQDSLTLFDAEDLFLTATAASVTTCTAAAKSYHVAVCSPNISKLTIKAHGIPIYNDFPAGFFNSYIPYNYGGHNVRTPKDCGALMVTFCLYPGTYQPSGHINVSRAREFYLDYTTTAAIASGAAGSLVIVASAINFLLISDGSAVLRYST